MIAKWVLTAQGDLYESKEYSNHFNLGFPTDLDIQTNSLILPTQDSSPDVFGITRT